MWEVHGQGRRADYTKIFVNPPPLLRRIDETLRQSSVGALLEPLAVRWSMKRAGMARTKPVRFESAILWVARDSG